MIISFLKNLDRFVIQMVTWLIWLVMMVLWGRKMTSSLLVLKVFPVKEYEGIDAEFQGIEVEVDWLAMENPGWDLLSFYGDLIRGKNKSEGGNLAKNTRYKVGSRF